MTPPITVGSFEKDLTGLHILCLYPSRCQGRLPVVYILEPVKNMGGLEDFVKGDGGMVLVSIFGMDWERDLTPWQAPRAYKRGKDFSGEATSFRKRLLEEVIPSIEEDLRTLGIQVDKDERSLVGISLAGLFSLQSGLLSPAFSALGSISGSFWYDSFVEYVKDLDPGSGKWLRKIYFSLGEQERNAKSPRLASVQERTEEIVRILRERFQGGTDILFEMNAGNHFSDPVGRIRKALSFLSGGR